MTRDTIGSRSGENQILEELRTIREILEALAPLIAGKDYWRNLERKEHLSGDELYLLDTHHIPYTLLSSDYDNDGYYPVLIKGEDMEQLEYYINQEKESGN